MQLKVCCLLTFLLLVCAPVNPAGTVASKEHQIKAAWLYQFARFVRWPEDRRASFTIGIFGDAPFLAALDSIKDKMVRGRPIEIRVYADIDRDFDQLHILFVNASEVSRLPDVLGQLRDRSVLIVGDSTGFIEQGGMINFVRVGFRQTFEVNLIRVEAAEMTISSQMLKVATRVERAAPSQSP